MQKISTYWLIIEIEFEEYRRMGAGRTAVHVQHLSHPEYNCVKGTQAWDIGRRVWIDDLKSTQKY